MQRKVVLKFIFICIFSVFVLVYNIQNVIKIRFKSSENTTDFNSQIAASTEEISAENKTKSNEKAEEKTAIKEETKQASKPADTEAIKGKIIEKYISPYSAPLSYDNVFLKNNTELKIDIKSLLNSPLSFKITETDLPQVLILHTHATETYMSEDTKYYTEDYKSRTTDNSKNMVKIGSVVAKKLNDAGIKTLHSTVKHDYPQYNGSYSNAAKTILEYQKKYPSIKVILDLHRDAVSGEDNSKIKLVTKINGKKAAQVMLVMGSQSGGVTNFPDWKENLKLAVRLQQKMEEKYPTLARPLLLMSKNYNESLSKGSLLIEFGTDANTIDEAVYSAELVGDSLVSLLKN